MQQTVAHQYEARVIGDLAPFVKIERERVRALDSLEARSEIGRQNRQRPAGSVDVEPEMLATRKIGQRAEIVNAAGIRTSSRAHQQERRKSSAAVRLDRLLDLCQIHPPAGSGGNQ